MFDLGHTNISEELVMSGLIHWQAKSQSVVALSTLEAEYIACSHATQESRWLRRMMKEAADGMAVKISDGPVPIGCDNQGAIKLIASGVVRQKSKHIDVKYHHVHDEQMKDSVKFQYVTSESNPADLLTKPVRIMGVRRWQPPESPSTGSGDSLPSFPPGESLGPVVYRENVPPWTLYQSINSLSSSLPIPLF